MSKCRYWQNIDPGNPSPVEQAIEELQEDVQRLEESAVAARADIDRIGSIAPTFGIFFDPDSGTDVTRLYRSENGVDFRTLHVFDQSLRDPSYAYVAGKHLIAHTKYSAAHDFYVAVSEDFETWEDRPIYVSAPRIVGEAEPGRTYGSVWAPEFFYAGDQLYYMISVEDTLAATPGSLVPGASYKTFHPYYGTVYESVGDIMFSDCAPLSVNWHTTSGYIDADIIYKDGVFLLAAKNEASAQIEIYSATSITGTFEYLKTLPPMGVEGCCWYEDQSGALWIYADLYQTALYVPCYIRINYATGLAECLRRDHKLRHGCVFDSPELASKYRNVVNTSEIRYSDTGLASVENVNWGVINNSGIQAVIPDLIWYIGRTGNLSIKIRNITNADIRITQSTARSNDTLTLVQENSSDANITITGSEYARYHTISFAQSRARTTKFYISKG